MNNPKKIMRQSRIKSTPSKTVGKALSSSISVPTIVLPISTIVQMAPFNCVAIVRYPNNIPDALYQKCLPKVQGKNAFVEEHLEVFSYFLKDISVPRKDIKM